MIVEVYVCSCGNAVTAATVDASLPKDMNFVLRPIVLCPCLDPGANNNRYEMRYERFDVEDSKTRSTDSASERSLGTLRDVVGVPRNPVVKERL